MERMSEGPPSVPPGWIDCGPAYEPGDVIRFTETVWRHSKERLGERDQVALVEKIEEDAEGVPWVSLLALSSVGTMAYDDGHQYRRQRKNVERNGVIRRLLDGETPTT